MESECIGDVLNLPAAAARRLTREASRLHNRLEPDLEQEEVTYPPAALRVVGPGAGGLELLEAPRSDAVSRLDVRDRELLERVVKNWPDHLERAGEDVSRVSQSSIPVLPASEQAPSAGTLQPGDLDGLDAETCARLASIDVLTLVDLVESSVDDLVSGAGLPFTRARTLQFRAGKRRHVACQSPVDASPFAALQEKATEQQQAPEERFSPSDRPQPEPTPDAALDTVYEIPRPLAADHSGAAGPFA